MSQLVNAYLNKTVRIITTDSRTIQGELVSIDNMTNVVLKGAIERIIRGPDDDEPSSENPLGLYVIRGENVCVIGLVDKEVDDSIDWTSVTGAPIGGTKHT